MAEAVALLLNPADTTRGYVVYDHGDFVAFGGQPAIAEPPVDFTDRVIGGQIEDWDDPAGAAFHSDGKVVPFGDCAWEKPANLASWPIVRAIYANPSGANQGYQMLADGTIQKWGSGTADPAWEPTSNGTDRVRAWAYDWASGKSIVLRQSGSMESSMGITGYTATVKPGRDVYRALVTRSWVDAYPRFYVADMAGDIAWGNGAEAAPPTRHWAGQDAVRDLAVVNDGTGGDPLTLSLVTAWGGRHTWTASEPPVVNVLNPNGTVTNTTRPEVLWTYEDPNGDAQAAYHVRIFDEGMFTAPGFDPSTSVPYWETWSEYDARTTFAVTPTTDLMDGLYRAYVRARDTAGDLSDWRYRSFAMDVDPPDAPTLAVTPAGGWTVTVEVAAELGEGLTTVEIEHTDDDPEVVVAPMWITLRASGFGPGDEPAVVVDREPPLNRRRWYRARVRVDDIASPWTPVVSAHVAERACWVLSAPLEEADAVAVAIVPDVSWTNPVPAGVHRPPARREAIVVRAPAGRQSAEQTVTIRTLDAATHTELDRLLDGTRPLLLRSPYGAHRFVEVTEQVETKMLDALAPHEVEVTEMRHAHETTVTLVETARPA